MTSCAQSFRQLLCRAPLAGRSAQLFRHSSPSSTSISRITPPQTSSLWQHSLPSNRAFSVSSRSRHGHVEKPKPGEERKVTFIDKTGNSHTFEVADGANLLDIAQAYDLDVEGACGGSCACSTCHIIINDSDMYDKLSEPSDDENDMLDLAFGLTETSRLGCQVEMTKELDGLVVKLPAATRNLQKSDFEKS
ncbi:ferredoxin [Microthyrium microscopicum]|uniref:Ferredoxin n=1 Tax=Microthyrium microscopicum TaxID=703497 RepID=A0A6A6UPZ5_9PEZI|nr:ferredoxin [Microthyrium microscopicum]